MTKAPATITYITLTGVTATGRYWADAPEPGAVWIVVDGKPVKVRKRRQDATEYAGKWVEL